MARLYSDSVFSGTFGNLTVYRVGGKSYVRTKSSLDKKRFYKDPAFAKSREKATLFGVAAGLVKGVYRALPKEVKRHGLFGKLTAIAYKSLQEDKGYTTVIKELKEYCGVTPTPTPLPARQRKHSLAGKRPHLSTWRVTASGRLQTVASATPLPVESPYRVTVITRLRDG